MASLGGFLARRVGHQHFDVPLLMNRYLLIAGLLGGTGVAAGAFGAHALQASVSPERIDIWETAAQYHLIHAAVILALALHSQADENRWRFPMMGFTAGVLLFSFSLYALVLADITQLAMITPIGGLLLILSWLLVAINAFK
ncbi:MAG: DUF423 domain-containing protein [Halieaceae bacterium]|nr:MAG: DUF423 domain-containing protein [Halieaceae bacterium]